MPALLRPPPSVGQSCSAQHAYFVPSDPSRLAVPLPHLDRPPSRRSTLAAARTALPATQPLLAAASSSSSSASASTSAAGESSSSPQPRGVAAWRQHSRTRTSAACLVLCLNIGVDPPDSARSPAASALQCWMEPSSLPPLKALKQIGARLQAQYERWSSQCAYRLLLDPTSDDLRKLVTSVRKQAASPVERVLLHYNGHGVPRPTGNGEVWVYNRGYTQYIPVSMYDVQAWMGGVGGAGVYVIDCSAAGLVMDAFMHFLKQRKDKITGAGPPAAPDPTASDAATASDPYDCRHIFLCACGATESLPSLSHLPADLFTACLTTPIKTALRFAISRSTLCRLQPSSVDSLPGMKKPNNRRSAYGELNWIFTAITDAIAWSTLPLPLFQQLFRHDLLVASLFRNYWLAERIMHAHGVHTVTHPPLPNTHSHPMWAAWDVCVDVTLAALERFELKHDPAVFAPSAFFSQQLTAFEVYLDYAEETDPPPLQLPVLLQVLLSSDHRKRALLLLARYIDKGGWAVSSALNVGVFPYVLKLLQSVDEAMRPCLVFIWAKIVGWDDTVVADLCKSGGDYVGYFARHLLGAKADGDRDRIRDKRQQQPQVEDRDEDDGMEEDRRADERDRRDGNNGSSGNTASHHSVSSSLIFAPSPHFLSPATSLTATPSRTPSLLPTHPLLPPPPLSSSQAPSSIAAPHAVTDSVAALLSTRPLQQLLSAFILTAIAVHNPRAASATLSPPLTSLTQLLQPAIISSAHPLLRRWLLLLTAALLSSSAAILSSALSEHLVDHVYPLLFDPTPEVRAAALLALSAFVAPPSASKDQQRVELELHLGYVMSALAADGSALVRRECVLAVGEVVWAHSELFVAVSGSASGRQTAKKAHAVWRALLRLCRDAHPTVSTAALELRKWVKSRVLFANPLGRMIQSQHKAAWSEVATKNGIRELPAFSPVEETALVERLDKADREREKRTEARRERTDRTDGKDALRAVDGSGSLVNADEHDESEDIEAPLPPARPSVPLAGPLRHFDRYKMSHMRPHPNAVLAVPSAASAVSSIAPMHSSPASSSRRMAASPSPGGVEDQPADPSSAPAASSSSASSSASPATSSTFQQAVDDRVNDPTWTLPRSSLYLESARYFSAPLLTPPSSFQPIPPLHSLSAQSARSSLQSALSARASALSSEYVAGEASNARSFVEVAFFDTEWTSCGGGGGGDGGGVVLHPFDNVLVACDDRSGIGVWRYGVEEERGQERVNAFSNENVRGSRITKIALVNSGGEGSGSLYRESDERGQAAGLLMCASDDGVVRLWRGMEQAGKQSLVTAWTACPAPDGLAAGAVARTGLDKSSLPRQSPPLTGKAGGVGSTVALPAALYAPSSSPSSLSYVASYVIKADSLSTPLLGAATTSPPSSHSLPPASTSFSIRRRTAHPPVTFDWNQSSGQLCVAGHGQSSCRLWDVATERCVLDVSVPPGSRHAPPTAPDGLSLASCGISCMLFSPIDSSTVYVGSRDGSVHVLDIRSGQSSHLRSHSSPIVSLQAQLFNNTLLSASSNGDVLVSDYRLSTAATLSPAASPLPLSSPSPSSPLSTRQLHRPSHHSPSSPLTCFSAHRHLPLLASGSSRPFVDLFDTANYTLEQIRYHYGFLGQRLGSVSSVVYHDYKQLVAVGCLDPYISIFAAEAL